MEVKNLTEMLVGMQKRLFSFAYSLTMNKDDAQDLLQTTSLKVLNNSEKFVNNENFSGWIFTIMRNIFINDYHSSANKYTVFDNEEGTVMRRFATNPADDTPESTFAMKEINKAIKGLSDEYRVPFSLYVAGYKYQEIADRMELPIGTVKSRIFSSRRQLQDQLKEYRYD
ncbi:RNA polymerase sigma factor [Coprobacter tertius]|uniref:Sigma-70 family RNA polymerase sigma factor n=1 Tax=Coprobacter tertius TaxID=2944915 RepID=A0ABT1MI60_9BACT|nr:sigma-70 family RNA polymerase sigma factor [Coprobacter tertius]MCP9612317.1 sigma-70 family RNA polymerase sigma factor [Coprobacter tertius]